MQIVPTIIKRGIISIIILHLIEEKHIEGYNCSSIWISLPIDRSSC